jgi:hypothetical protein
MDGVRRRADGVGRIILAADYSHRFAHPLTVLRTKDAGVLADGTQMPHQAVRIIENAVTKRDHVRFY